MESLATAAGVNKTIVYRVFPNRSAVLVALFDREVAALGERLRVAAAEADGFEPWLRAAVHAWFDALASGGRLLDRMLDTGPGDPELDARRAAWSLAATREWGEGVASATGAPLPDAMDTVAIVLAGMRGAISRWLDDRRPRRVVEERYLQVALAALAHLGPAAAPSPSDEGRTRTPRR